jgi:MscS family membrane protein
MIFGQEIGSIIMFLFFVISGLLIGKIITNVGNLILNKTKYKLKIYNILLSILKKPEPIMIIVLFIFVELGLKYLTISMSFLNFLKGAFHVIYVFAIAWVLIKFLIGVIDEYIAPKTKSKKAHQVIPALRTTSAILVIVVAIVILLSNMGYDVTTLLAGLGIGGLAVAFAAKDLLENLISGVMLFSEKDFNVGDTIKVNDILGNIHEVGLRTTKIKTFDGTLVVLPNAKIATGVFENLSSRIKRREFFTIGVTYDTSIVKLNKAKQIIKKILTKHPFVDSDNVFVSFEKFNDFSLDIRIIYFILEMDYGKFLLIKDEVNTAIKKEFEKEKISIAFPTQTIEIKK